MLAFGSIFKCLSKGRQIKWFLGSIQNKTVTSVIYKCSHCFRVKNNSYTFQLHQCKSSIIKIDPWYGLYVLLSKNISSCAALSIDGVFLLQGTTKACSEIPQVLHWRISVSVSYVKLNIYWCKNFTQLSLVPKLTGFALNHCHNFCVLILCQNKIFWWKFFV